MSSWIEQAAERAVELAEELCTPIPEDEPELFVTQRRLRVAAHLTYMAGLVRGLEMMPMEEHWRARLVPDTTEVPGPELLKLRDEAKRLRHLNAVLAEDWRRIEKLVGREFTSSESTIDRVAWLVEQENERTALAAELKESRKEYAATALQLAKLLQAARRVIDDETVPVQRSVSNLTDVVERIQREIAGP